MKKTADYTTTEIGNSCLRLRSDLQFSLRTYEGEACYVIEDPATSRFFRIGVSEYILISMFDGNTSVEEATAATATALRGDAFDSDQVAQICKWLIDSNLASTQASTTADRMYDELTTTTKKESRSLLSNPIMIHTELGNPDRFFDWLTARVGWLVSGTFIPIWLMVCTYGAYLIFADWDRFVTATSSVLTQSNWWMLLLIWAVLKFFHECGHGVTCKRFGGSVNKVGIVWLLLLPMPFVDVSSSWGFNKRSQRILTAAGGMIVELFLAGVAAIVWSNTEFGIINQTAANIVITGSLVTFLFNANPLMRFDGYYILSDVTNTPNLSQHSRQWLSNICRRFFLGIESTEQEWPEGKKNLVRTYAILAFLWRISISISLMIAAANLLEGFGLLLAVFAAVLWFAMPVYRFITKTLLSSDTSNSSRIVFATRAGCIALFAVAILYFAPSPATIRAPAVIDNQEVEDVRSLSAGFIEKVHVVPGQEVRTGDLLVTMANRELVAEFESLKIEAQAALHEAAIYQENEDLVAYQIAMSSYNALQKQIKEMEVPVNALQVRTSIDGRVTTGQLDSLPGRFVQKGDVVCVIAGNKRKVLRALVAQQDLKSVRGDLSEDVTISVWGTGNGLKGRIDRIEPAATTRLIHSALAAPAGGPLSVIAAEEGESKETAQETWQLIEPRVPLTCVINKEDAFQLRAGQLAEVQLRLRNESLGTYLWIRVNDWINSKLKINHGV